MADDPRPESQAAPSPTQGRPTLCTKELADEMARLLRKGNYVTTACAYVGVSQSTVYRWMDWGEAEKARREEGEAWDTTKDPYVYFWDTIARARAEPEIASVARIRKHARNSDAAGDASCDQWWLARMFPDRWGTRDRAQDGRSGAQPITITIETPWGADPDEDDDPRQPPQ